MNFLNFVWELCLILNQLYFLGLLNDFRKFFKIVSEFSIAKKNQLVVREVPEDVARLTSFLAKVVFLVCFTISESLVKIGSGLGVAPIQNHEKNLEMGALKVP